MQPRKLQCCIWRETIKPSLRFSWFCLSVSKGNPFWLLLYEFLNICERNDNSWLSSKYTQNYISLYLFIIICIILLFRLNGPAQPKICAQILTHPTYVQQLIPALALHWYILYCPMIILRTVKALTRLHGVSLRCPHMLEDTFLYGAAQIIVV